MLVVVAVDNIRLLIDSEDNLKTWNDIFYISRFNNIRYIKSRKVANEIENINIVVRSSRKRINKIYSPELK